MQKMIKNLSEKVREIRVNFETKINIKRSDNGRTN